MERASDDDAEQRAPLSVEAGDHDDDDNDNGAATTTAAAAARPLDDRILELIERVPDRTVRPGRLAAELGLSVEDASAELCGLLAAVGGGHGGATFRFEPSATATQPGGGATAAPPTAMTMVFSFPPDFAKRARRNRRQRDLKQAARQLLLGAVRVLKIVTAFGLILSLLIVSVAALMATVAAVVALSRGSGNQGHRRRGALLRQVRLVFYSVRQMLWCYALLGPTGGDEDGSGSSGQQQDPFLREVAYDMALICSVCCGNPGSIFYWMRMNQLQQRRHRLFRGWGGRRTTAGAGAGGGTGYSGGSMQSDIPGVTLMRRGDHATVHSATTGSSEHKGLLSVAVEFLFGPTPFAPGPTEAETWILRSAALMQMSTKSRGAGVSLEAMAPYVDFPPESIEDSAKIVEQSLLIVAHFNGIPAATTSTKEPGDGTNENDHDPRKANFVFPELMAESSVTTRYEQVEVDHDDGTWQSVLFSKHPADGRTSSAVSRSNSSAIPSYLKENRCRFTKLTSPQLLHCLALGSLNLVGVIWFQQAVAPGGLLPLVPGSSLLATLVLSGLLPVLQFYARLFFVLPAGRLLLIVALNQRRQKRNGRRARLVARTLGSSP